MKREKLKVINNLKKLHKKMLADMVEWSKLYSNSGTIEYLKDHNDKAFSVHEIIMGKVDADDIVFQIKYIEQFVKENQETK